MTKPVTGTRKTINAFPRPIDSSTIMRKIIYWYFFLIVKIVPKSTLTAFEVILKYECNIRRKRTPGADVNVTWCNYMLLIKLYSLCEAGCCLCWLRYF